MNNLCYHCRLTRAHSDKKGRGCSRPFYAHLLCLMRALLPFGPQGLLPANV